MTEDVPFLLTAERLQPCPHGVDAAHWYWIHPAEKEPGADKQDGSLDKADPAGSKDEADAAPEGDSGVYVLRPSLLPHLEELLAKNTECADSAAGHGESDKTTEGRSSKGHNDTCKYAPSLFGMSGLVFRNVPINLWALPSFHQLVLKGIFPSECDPAALLGQRLESLLGPHGVSLVKEDGGLSVTAKPVGVVGNLSASNHGDHTSITACLNLDLLAVVLFSLPDWRLLWSRDPRFSKQFAVRPSPGEAFHPFSLFPEHISFDISFWTASTYQEKEFHAVVREASHGTVERVKLIDRFSHPELSQTSYCYRLTYHSHTHALSHSQALQFHKQLESLLASRLQVTIR